MPDIKHPIIGGRYTPCKETTAVRSPYNGEIIAEIGVGGKEEAEAAVAASVRAFDVTKNLSSYERYVVLRKIAEGLEKRREEMARIIALEAGKPITDARGEVGRAVTTFTVASEETKRWGGELMPLDITAATKGRWGITRRFPAGPVLGITPFNFPINLVAHKVAPALAVGNPIIIKPAEKTPLTAMMLGEIMLESGWPEEAISVVYLHVPLVEGLIRDERLRVVSFTGSAPVGWHIRSICGSIILLLTFYALTRLPVADVRVLMVAAIDSPSGTAQGLLTGKDAGKRGKVERVIRRTASRGASSRSTTRRSSSSCAPPPRPRS